MLKIFRPYLADKGLGLVLINAVTGSAGLRLAGIGFGFLVGVQLARGLGAEGYGIYGIAMSIISLLLVPTEFGLPQLLTREIAAAHVKQEWGHLKGVLQWASRVSIYVAIFIGSAIAACLMLWGPGLSTPLSMTLLTGAAMIPVVSQVSMRSAALRGLQFFVRGQLPDVLLRPMFYSSLLFVTPYFFIRLRPEIAMALGAASAAMALLAAQFMLSQALPDYVKNSKAATDSHKWLHSAFPMALAEGMRVFQGQISILIAGFMLPIADVGIYRLAISVATLVAMPISLFNIIGGSMIARAYAQNDIAKLKRLMSLLALGMTVGVTVLMLPLVLFGKTVVETFFGKEFSRAVDIILILSSGFLIGSAFGSCVWLLNMSGHHKRVTRASFIGLISLLLLTPPGIYWFGVHGAAMASGASFFIWNTLMWRDGIRLLGINSSIFSLARTN